MRKINQITVNGKKIDLTANQVVCFVGSNSSGKSSALEGIYHHSLNKPTSRKCAIDGIEVEPFETKEAVASALVGKLTFSGGKASGRDFTKNWGGNNSAHDLITNEMVSSQKNEYNQLFHHLIDAKNRFSGVEPTANIDFLSEYPTHPFHFFYKNPELEKEISEISHKIFGIELSLNPAVGQNLYLHIGKRINPQKFGGNRTQEYANELSKLPLIASAGDGYKAAMGLTGQILTSNASAFFVDEPDLYLHPPQAFQLAKTICREKAHSQLFFSTHSARFAQGLFEESADRLILIRLMKNEDVFSSKTVQSEVFSDIKNDPVLKFSQISEGMFYEKTYLCEDSSDCLFYQNGIDKLDLEKNENNALWVGINGKTNFCKVAKTAKKLGLDPICVADFDILSEKNDCYKNVLKPLIELLSGSTDTELNGSIDQIIAMVKADRKLTWEILKTQGVDATTNNQGLYKKIMALLDNLKSIGIIIVPYGEVESLHVPRLGKGLDAINEMLEKDIVGDAAMSKARSFLCSTFG